MTYDQWKLRSPDDERELQEGRPYVEPRKCCAECPGDDTCEHANVCMCGGRMDHYCDEGHSPVSMHDYYCEEVAKCRSSGTDQPNDG